jgi:hypothetical protein
MMMKLRGMKWAGYVSHMEKMRNEYNILDRKHEGERPLGRPKHI